MKTLFKIVITLVILTACFQAARYYLNNFQFEDAAQQRLLFETKASDSEVVTIVMRLANEYQLPLKADDVSVRMIGTDRVVEMEYTENVPLIPGVFTYPWKFTPRTSTKMLSGISGPNR
ncbi:MAG TPA: hypothetical protein VJ691_05470 [Vicinamibacterales bacterium]|nr:hypothetical protein [Vicinamibacterales bacterium]